MNKERVEAQKLTNWSIIFWSFSREQLKLERVNFPLDVLFSTDSLGTSPTQLSILNKEKYLGDSVLYWWLLTPVACGRMPLPER